MSEYPDYARAVADAIAAGDHATVASLAVEMAGQLTRANQLAAARKLAQSNRTRRWQEKRATSKDVVDVNERQTTSTDVSDDGTLSPLVPPSPLPEPIPSPPYNPPSPDSGERPPRPAKLAVDKPPSWVAQLRAVWSEAVGPVPFGRIGKVFGESVERHGVEAIVAAMERYIATMKATSRGINLQWFANEINVWVERARIPLVEDGELTEEGQRLLGPSTYRRTG